MFHQFQITATSPTRTKRMQSLRKSGAAQVKNTVNDTRAHLAQSTQASSNPKGQCRQEGQQEGHQARARCQEMRPWLESNKQRLQEEVCLINSNTQYIQQTTPIHNTRRPAGSRSSTQHSATSRNITQHHATPRNTTQHHAAPRNTTQHHAAPRSILHHHNQYTTAHLLFHAPQSQPTFNILNTTHQCGSLLMIIFHHSCMKLNNKMHWRRRT